MKNALLIFNCVFFIVTANAQTSTHTSRASASATVGITVKVDTGSFYMRPTQEKGPADGTDFYRSARITFELFPDPATDHITLRLTNPGPDRSISLTICGINGKMLYEKEDIPVSNTLSYSVNTAAFSPGNYVLTIRAISGELYRSIIFVKQ